MKIDNTTEEWYCHLITVKGQLNGDPVDINFPCGGMFNANASRFDSPFYDAVYAPSSMSFACTKLTFLAENYTLILEGMQVRQCIFRA